MEKGPDKKPGITRRFFLGGAAAGAAMANGEALAQFPTPMSMSPRSLESTKKDFATMERALADFSKLSLYDTANKIDKAKLASRITATWERMKEGGFSAENFPKDAREYIEGQLANVAELEKQQRGLLGDMVRNFGEVLQDIEKAKNKGSSSKDAVAINGKFSSRVLDLALRFEKIEPKIQNSFDLFPDSDESKRLIAHRKALAEQLINPIKQTSPLLLLRNP